MMMMITTKDDNYNNDDYNDDNQVRTIFLQWIPWVLRMARPGEKITRKTIMMQVSVTVAIKVQAIIGGSSVIVLANIDAN